MGTTRASVGKTVVAPSRGLLSGSSARLGWYGYSGPLVPGYGQLFSPLPRVPEQFRCKYVFPHGLSMFRYLVPNYVYWSVQCAFILGLYIGHFFYSYQLRPINPPNPPRDKADDLRLRPKVHPHMVEED